MRRGDALAEELLTEASARLAQAIVSLVHTLNPELVLFGGGLLAIADLLIDPAIELARPQIFPQHLRGLRFGKATLGDDAGVLGAAWLALDSLQR
jgi:glucokinase